MQMIPGINLKSLIGLKYMVLMLTVTNDSNSFVQAIAKIFEMLFKYPDEMAEDFQELCVE